MPQDYAALAKRFGGTPQADAQPATFDGSVLFDPNRKPASAEDFTPPDQGGSAPGRYLSNVVTGLNPMNALASLAMMFVDPVGSAVKAGEAQFAQGDKAIDAAKQGHISEAVGHGAAALLPLIGPAAAQAGEQIGSGDVAGGLGAGTALVGSVLAPGAIKAGVEAIPTTAKAGAKFQSVMASAKDIPVDVKAPGDVALRISDLADRGGSMPMAVRKFLNRTTAPGKGPLTYQEARDFASNISRLSANEYGKLTPAVAREVADLRVKLNQSVAEAAQKAGKGAEYKAAMREYAQAMKIKNAVDSVAEGAKKALPYASAAGAGTWLTMKLKNLFGGGE